MARLPDPEQRYVSEKSKSPYGQLTTENSVPLGQSTAGRIAELSQNLSEAAAHLEMARHRVDETRRDLELSQARYAKLKVALIELMEQHHEGVPPGVPYQDRA